MSRRRSKKPDKKDFLQIFGNFNSHPFDWDHLNQNSREAIIQMCINLRIPVDTDTMSKSDLIRSLAQYPKMISASNTIPPFMNGIRLQKLEYPPLLEPERDNNRKSSTDESNSENTSEAIQAKKNNDSIAEIKKQALAREEIKFRTDLALHGTLSSHLWRYILRKHRCIKKEPSTALFTFYVFLVTVFGLAFLITQRENSESI